MKLNEGQIKAIEHIDGPMMVLAGPGSGKTSVITYRTKRLIDIHNIRPENILVITFSRAAADEMKERFLKINNQTETKVVFGTFHSVFFRILRMAESYSISELLDDDKKNKIFKMIIKKIDLQYEDENEYIKDISSEISYVKNELLDINNYYSSEFATDLFRDIYFQYEQYKNSHHLIDFDDMLVKCYNYLICNKNLLRFWQNRIKYILVDEFQDINCVQYECIRMLARPNNNLFIVGDDDQSIYQFRGARPDFLLKFPKEYKDSKRVLLDINYRSTKEIVNNSLRIISKNTKRYSKNLKTNNQIGVSPIIQEFNDINEEAEYVSNEILKYIKKNVILSDIAIIYRTNFQARPYIGCLMDLNIPFVLRDQISNIFEHWISKDILAFFALTRQIKDADSLVRVINKPKNYISKEILAYANNYSNNIWEGLYKSYDDKPWMTKRLDEFMYHILKLKKMKPTDGIIYIRDKIGYSDYLEDYSYYRKINVESLLEIIDELYETAKPYESLEMWLAYIESYAVKIRETKNNRANKENAVTLTTMHSSKGLEYKIVFIISANEGCIPHEKSNNEYELEEERRLFYVGMTRTKEILYISYVKDRLNKEAVQSRFLKEMISMEK